MRISTVQDLEITLSTLLLISVLILVIPFFGLPVFTSFLVFYSATNFRSLGLRMNLFTILLAFVVCTYLIGLLNANVLAYSVIQMDIINILTILLLVFYIGNRRFDYQKVFISFLEKCARVVPLFAFLSLLKFWLLSSGIRLSFLMGSGGKYPFGTSLVPDYNMFSLGICFGIIGVARVIRMKPRVSYSSIYYTLCLMICMLAIALSGSRRGMVALVLLTIYFMVPVLVGGARRLVRLRITKRNLYVIITFMLAVVLLKYSPFVFFDGSEFTKVLERAFTVVDFSQSYSGRTDRWVYGLNLIDDFNFFSCFRRGFDYIRSYANEFGVSGGQDYPHNPVISSFLYSGVFGACLVLLMYLLPLLKLLKHRKYGGSDF